ncbi:MAG: transglutaminase domain-containing protein [Eubacteriales bacterium]
MRPGRKLTALLLAGCFTAQMLITGGGAVSETDTFTDTANAESRLEEPIAATAVYTENTAGQSGPAAQNAAVQINHGQRLTESLTVTYINPLYADVITEADLISVPQNDSGQNYALEKSAAEEASYVTTLEEAGAILRSGMKKREETVEVSVYYASYTKEMLQEDMMNMADIALGHTGQPTEGDYLRWQYGGWNCTANGVYEGEGAVWTFQYTITYYTTYEQEQEMDSAVASLLQKYDDPEEDMYTRIKTMYDYICDHVVYDYDNLEDDTYKLKYTAYAALINKTAVCQGYAILLYRLALELGADARLISGTGNGGAHGWNIVELGELYYNADSTWDAGRDPYDYFLLCDRNFENHTRDDEYLTEEFYAEYPMGETDYVYTPGCVHTWNEGQETKAATCTEEGKIRYTCTQCGATKTEKTEPTGHRYIDEVTAPTCTEGGYTTHTCTVCGDSYTDSYTDAVGHNFIDGICTVCHAKEFGTCAVYGTVTSYSTKSAPDALVNITIFDENGDMVGAVFEVPADENKYSNELECGIYSMQVSKQNHVTRIYEIIATNAEVNIDIKICLLGDANMDGRINVRDYNAIFRYVTKDEALDGAYAVACADINDDGKIDVRDYNKIFNHVSGKSLLW